MALFIKQDFSPPVLSRRWIAIRCRPNMLLQCRSHVISILECGLLFREDSATVEQSAPTAEAVWRAVGAGYSGWLTNGERWLSVGAVGAAIVAAPPGLPMSGRGACVRLCAYAGCVLGVRTTHRLLTRSCLPALLGVLCDYTSLTRRTMQCLKQYQIVHKDLGSMSALLDTALSVLWQQQSALTQLMCRCSVALLDNMPWLYEQLNWDSLALVQEKQQIEESVLWKIHHAYLVIQSTLLKHIAMAHYIPPQHSRRKYLNHNERLYWLHTQILEHLYSEVKENYEALDRMYRLLKNIGPNDMSDTVKRSGMNKNDMWLYSDVHGSLARANIDLKIALNKCTKLDVFLDNCAAHKQDLDFEILNADIECLVEDVTACLNAVQTSHMKLKKIQTKFNRDAAKYNPKAELSIELSDEDAAILKIEDKEPETRDEVFYFVKTEEDGKCAERSVDVMTAPGKKERDATKIVLCELKRKLVKREDAMREREKIALEKMMPELKGKLPEFPRQMPVDHSLPTNGYISKITRKKREKMHIKYLIQSYTRKSYNKALKMFKNCKISRRSYKTLSEIKNPILINFAGKVLPKVKGSKLKIDFLGTVTTSIDANKRIKVTKWVREIIPATDNDVYSSSMSEGLSDVESSSTNKIIHQAINKKIYNKNNSTLNNFNNASFNQNEARNDRFSKEELDLSSSNDSDFDTFAEKNKKLSLLKDVRRHRVARKKNYPARRTSLDARADGSDAGLRPVEYSFGTGMALASVFQDHNGVKFPALGQEEVFAGDGEVSGDSGNDENS